MSNCCDNPWVSTPPEGLDDVEYKIYNPSEVRLYGRPASSIPDVEVEPEDFLKNVREKIENSQLFQQNFQDKKDEFWRVANDIVTLANERIEYSKNRLSDYLGKNILVSIKYEDKTKNRNEIHTLPISVSLPGSGYGADWENYIKSIGIIYGYAYEGHCYKLPKPQIMFLPEKARNIPGDDCGCDCGYSAELGYAVWQIDKLQRVIALDIRSDDLKTLVLEENMPGKRSPQAYSQGMSLAPQRLRD